MVIAPSNAAPAQTRGSRNARRTTRSKKSSKKGGRRKTTNIDIDFKVQKWIQIHRRPQPHVLFEVKKWVPVAELTPQERIKYSVDPSTPAPSMKTPANTPMASTVSATDARTVTAIASVAQATLPLPGEAASKTTVTSMTDPSTMMTTIATIDTAPIETVAMQQQQPGNTSEKQPLTVASDGPVPMEMDHAITATTTTPSSTPTNATSTVVAPIAPSTATATSNEAKVPSPPTTNPSNA